MQVAVESAEGLERKVHVEVPEDEISRQVNSRLQSMLPTARLPGFRPGKVPMKVLERRLGRQVRDEVVEELIRSTLVEALEKESLRPAGGPRIDPVQAEPGSGLSYTATFEVYPEVELEEIGSLVVRRPVAEVTDEDVDRMLDVLRRQRRTWQEVERPAQMGDRVTVDFVGTIDGEPFEGGSAEEFEIELGQSRLIEGFAEGLPGASAGEQRSLDLQFPEDFPAEHLRGRPVHYEVTVKKVEEPVLPEMDEEFVRSFGVEAGDLESFRAEVRANMERELAGALKARTRERVLEVLLERNPIEVPHSLVHEEAHRIAEQRTRELASMGIDAREIGLDPHRFEDEARRRVQLGLLLAELVRSTELQADPERVRSEVERIASAYEDPQQVVNFFYSDPGRLSQIESQVLEEQAIESILERATVEEEPTTFDAIMNPEQGSAQPA